MMETEPQILSDITVINSIKELVLDEEKIVTYISLSKDLCIHVNRGKSLLHRALETIRKEKSDLQLNINYIISGLSDVNMGRTVVCSEQDLDYVRKTFNIIFFEHIYSISKGIPKNAAIILLNKFEDFAFCKGYIKSNESIKHSPTDISNLKNCRYETNVTDTKHVAQSNIKIKQETNQTIVDVSNGHKESKPTEDSDIKSAVSIKKENPINVTNGKQNNLKMQKGIAGFFNKPGATSKKISPDLKKLEDNDVKTNNIKAEVVVDMKATETIEINKNNTENSNKNINLSKTNKRLNHIKKTSKVNKNRKRVLQVSDSDSDEVDPFSLDKQIVEDSEDEIPPTPMTNNIKITAALVNPKKKRKIIDKTFMDEEGYILTKKVEVYESDSENEEISIQQDQNGKEVKNEEKIETLPNSQGVKIEVSPNKKNGTKSKKNITPPQKGKQPTLTNFFKKK